LDGAAQTGAAEPAGGAEAPVAAGPTDGLVVGEGPGGRAGAGAAGDRAADAEAPEPAAAALRAGAGGSADRLVRVAGGPCHRVVAAHNVQPAAGGEAALASVDDPGAARAGEGQVVVVAAAVDGRRPAEDLDGTVVLDGIVLEPAPGAGSPPGPKG